jgi:hypothetical protein
MPGGQKPLEHIVPLFRAGFGGLKERPSCRREPKIFVVVVVVCWIGLKRLLLEQRLRQPVGMLRTGQAPSGRRQRVHAADGELRVMATASQAEVAARFEGGFHDRGRRAEELHPLGAAVLDGGQPRAGGLRCLDRLDVVVGARKRGIGKDPGSIDAVLGGGLLLFERPRQPVDASGLADGGDAMRQPQLVDVIGRRHRTVFGVKCRADMRVAVDKAGGQEFAGAIDLDVTGGRSTGGLDRKPGRTDPFEYRDPAAFHHDVSGSPRRGSRAVDDGGAAQHQALERAASALPRNRRLHRRKTSGGKHFRKFFAGIARIFLHRRRPLIQFP